MFRIIPLLTVIFIFNQTPARAADLCSVFEKQATFGNDYFDQGRYLLAATQLSTFVLMPECGQSRGYSKAELNYVISLFQLDESVLARNVLSKSRLPQRPLLSSLLWGETQLLTPEDAARIAAWNEHDHPNDAVERARALVSGNGRELPVSLQSLAKETESNRVSPAFAAVASAIIPGSGQAYAGAWQSAGLSLITNGLLLATTVQLANRNLAAPAILSGMVFSFTYVGGVISAYQAADAKNQSAQRPFNEALFGHLFPDLPAYSHFQK